MTTLVSSILDITRSKACRLNWSRWGTHRFGGSPKLDYLDFKLPAPVHHIFSLDTFDIRSPIRFEGVRFIPLIYPLSYSSGGGEISYQIAGEGKVRITHLSEYREDDPPYFLLDELPERRSSLVSLTYAERRILGSSVRDRSFLDRWRMQRLWNGECFRVAGIMEYHSRLGASPCPATTNIDRKNCSGWRFASFPATKHPFGDIWHEYSPETWFCFAVCFSCGTIHAFNQCD
jgi:hypothetical protein